MSRGTNCLAQDHVTKTRFDRAFQDKIDFAGKNVLEQLFHRHVAIERLLVKIDEEIDVAIGTSFSSCE